jgi:hypothetical protein
VSARIADGSNVVVVLNVLHCFDCLQGRRKFIVALFVSFPSLSIALNPSAAAFDSEVPIHRASSADVLLEVATRSTTHGSLKRSCAIVAVAVTYASNISSSSAVSLFRVVEAVKSTYLRLNRTLPQPN